MTVAYILGDGSKHDNLELRLSLRSAEKHLQPDRVLVCGHDPGFLSENVEYIPNFPAKKENDAAWGIKENLLALCSHPDTPDEFVLMNDDVFILQPIKDFPHYHKGELREAMERIGSGIYYSHLLATVTVLEGKKLPTKHFDGHWPILYSKQKLLRIINETDWGVPLGPTIRSLYCNTYGIEGEYREDVKANRPQNDWDAFCAGKDCISVSDESFDCKSRDYFISLWGFKSKYER